MAEISDALGSELVSRVVGYEIKKGTEGAIGSNLPQRIAILGQANSANQAIIGAGPLPKTITSAAEAASEYGYGSPLHQVARILRPPTGGGVGGIETVFYPQLEGSNTATSIDITVTLDAGAPTKNVAHRLIINGRDNVDGAVYEFVITTTDTVATINQKIIDAIDNVIGAPITAASALDVITTTTKWKGVTSSQLDIEVDVQGTSAGITYVIDNKVDGAGSSDITDALDLFGNEWNTIVINPYGEDKFDQLELFNGTPDNKSGRYAPEVFKPFVALFGNTLSDKDAIALITDLEARQDQTTQVMCQAPNSKGWDWEAAANVAVLMAVTAQNTPHLDINAKSYSDMPTPENSSIGDMAQYLNRDFLVKRGASTVTLENGKYTIQDTVTTYHPIGETPPQFRYTRNLILDWNIRYRYLILEAANVIDKALADNDATVAVSDVIKPKEWKALLFTLADDLARDALIVDVDFMKNSIEVQSSGVNPDRLNTFFRYKRSSTVRIASTTAEANFAYNL